MALQIRRGPTEDRTTKRFAQGELIFDTTLNEVFIGDSTDGITGTLGGRPVTSFTSDQARDAAASIFDNPDHENITFTYDPVTKKITASVPDDVAGIFNVADDLTPELGGNLSLNSKNINGTGNINITGSVTSTGDIQTTAGSLKGDHIGVVRSGDGSTIVVNNGTDGTNAVFTGSLNGNAATVTNGVVTTGSYADPTWITSLAGTKVTDAVLTTGSYSDPTWITSLDGSKVNGAVLTSNSYSDPTWITSLDGSKVSGVVLTSGSYSDPSWITSLDGSKVSGVVLTSGSYSDPSWITSLDGSKITGDISGNAGSVTNGVYTEGDQTINGTKTFTSAIIADVEGNLSNATNVAATDISCTTLLVNEITGSILSILSLNAGTAPSFEIVSQAEFLAVATFDKQATFVSPETHFLEKFNFRKYVVPDNEDLFESSLEITNANVDFAVPVMFGHYSSAERDSLTRKLYIKTATWNTGVATINFSTLPTIPFEVGSQITVNGVTPVEYNGTFTVTNCTTSSVSYNLASDPGSSGTIGIYAAIPGASLPTSGGSGYQIGDTVSVRGGNYNAVLTVDTIDINGEVLTLLITNQGTGYVDGTYTTGTITGDGDDLFVDIQVSSVTGGVRSGTVIYNTTTNKFQGYANGSWVDFH